MYCNPNPRGRPISYHAHIMGEILHFFLLKIYSSVDSLSAAADPPPARRQRAKTGGVLHVNM